MVDWWEIGKTLFVWGCLGPTIVVLLATAAVVGLGMFLDEVSNE